MKKNRVWTEFCGVQFTVEKNRLWREISCLYFFEHVELPAQLLDYLLRSGKSNISQIIVNVARDALTIISCGEISCY